MQHLDTTQTVGQLAAAHPLAIKVFQRHRIDFCCGGGRSLAAACAERDADPVALLHEIASEEARAAAPAQGWEERPLGELIDHILLTYHQPLAEDLPRLEAMARKVLSVHGAKDPARLSALCSEVAALREELEQHMHKEEGVLFPWIRKGQGRSAGAPVRVMQQEHEATGQSLRRIRELTSDFTPPPGACATWRGLWQGLEALEAELLVHIHLENNVLFPRALGG